MRSLLYLSAGIILAATVFGLVWRQHQGPGPQTPSPATGPSATKAAPPEPSIGIHFSDLASASGIHFRHIDGRTPMHYLSETIGSGVAWLDYDQDGYLDLFLVQGGPFPPDPKEAPRSPTSRLYRNQGDGTFVDVTEAVGIRHPSFGQGVAVGDYDNDGYPDLFLTCFGHCHLFHNESDGRRGRRFREVTREAGVQLDGWCTCCAFGDLHGNGFLDLFVGRYVHMDLNDYPVCIDTEAKPPQRYTCGPVMFRGSPSVLLRNNGDGTFTDVSRKAGLEPTGKALGVVILDLDGDGKSDLFVGNDQFPNHHYRNLGGGQLQSCGASSGMAYNWKAGLVGSMGVEADDVTGHGRPDVLITNFLESTVLLRNGGRNHFTDVGPYSGLRRPSWDKVGWGACLFDVDHNGTLDLFVANGHVFRNAPEVFHPRGSERLPTFEMPAQLFRGNGAGLFREVSKEAGPYFSALHNGRGVAMGDYDNDGAMDIAINHCGDSAALLHNETLTPYHWIRLQLEGARHTDPAGSNRDAVGACVAVRAGGHVWVRHIKGGSSYLSSPDRRLLIGLGSADRVDEVEVRWPNARASTQRFGPLDVDRSYKLVEGAARAVAACCPPVRKTAGPAP